MRIRITTIREIPDELFWQWVWMLNEGNPDGPISGKELMEKRKICFSNTHRMGRYITRATTTYELISLGGMRN